MNRVHEQCPKIDSGTVLSQTGSKQAECTECTACWPSSTPRSRALPSPAPAYPEPPRTCVPRPCTPAPCGPAPVPPSTLMPSPAPTRPARAPSCRGLAGRVAALVTTQSSSPLPLLSQYNFFFLYCDTIFLQPSPYIAIQSAHVTIQ